MDQDTAAFGALGAVAGGVFFIVMMVVMVILIASVWKVFTKAGKPGWASIIPIYNIIVLLEIAGKPLWWLLLLVIPLVNIVVVFIVYISLAKSFGQSAGFGVGLVLLSVIFFPILGFGSARYIGPPAAVPQRV